jgi:hypothetical protein
MTTQEQKDKQKKKTKAKEAASAFPCEDFASMAEIMRKYCKDPGTMFQCCSMMEQCMKGKTETSGR